MFMSAKAGPAATNGHVPTLELPPAALELVAARFRALGEPVRLRILQILAQGECPVSRLVNLIGSTQPNISKHLRVLQDVGLVERRPQGSVANYAIADATVLELCDLVCAGVRERLESQVNAMRAKVFTQSR